MPTLRTFPRLAATAALALTLAAPTLAALGELKTPDIPFPKDYPASARAQVEHTLNRKDCKFVGGAWLNSWTTLNYQGETVPLNLFIEELTKCPGVTVHVGFKRLPDEDVDWRVGHDFFHNSFQVEVNTASKRVDLEKLYIPPYQGPAVKP